MQTNKNFLTFGLIIILGLLIWAPWITDEYVYEKLKNEPEFISMYNATTANYPLEIKWVPFGKLAISYNDVVWFMPFYGKIFP